MSKDLLRAYENGEMDEILDAQAQDAICSKRREKQAGRQDSKRTKESYISASKKGEASRASKAARKAASNSKPQGKREISDLSELQQELCGGRKNFNGRR